MRPMAHPSKRPASLALQCFIALLVVALVRPPVAWASAPELLTELSLGAGSPRVAVVVVSQDLRASQQQGALEGAGEAALERASRFSVLTVHDAFNPTAAQKQAENVESSREKMKTGKQALDDLDNVKATEAFTQALEALQRSDLSRNFPALLEAWIMKAAGHATGGENGPAKKDIESVVALSPKAEFSPTFFPPDLIKFAEAQRKFAANAKGELLVRTEPAGARVWVDGAYRGISPVTVAGLTGTKHFIAASEGGYALGQSQASPGEEVLSLAAAEIGPGWKKATSDIKKDPEGSTRDAAAQALGKAAKLDQVLLVISKKSLAGEQLDLIAIRLDVRDGHNLSFKTGTVNASDPEALGTFFDGVTGKDAKRDGKDPVHHFKGGGGSSVKTLAGISLLGVGAAGLITGAVFGIMAKLQADIFRATPQTRTMVWGDAKRNGQTFAAVADVSYIIGLLAAGTGGVLLLTNNGPAAEDETPAAKKSGGSDDARRRELDRKAAEDRRAAEERTREDERRREEERKRQEDKKDAKKQEAAEAKRRAEEEETRKKEEDAKKKEEEEGSTKKLSKKERDALEKKKREDEAKAKKEEERQAAEEKKRLEEEERAKKADEKKNAGKLTKKQQKEEEERKKKEDEEKEKQKAEEEARLKAEADAKKKKDDEERKKKEELEKKKKGEDHDDLRNF